MIGGALADSFSLLVTVFRTHGRRSTAPIYALLEGLFLGGISAVFEKSYPGIAVQAVGLTFAVLFVLLLAYKTGIVRATRGFKLGVIAATGAVMLVYAANLIMGLFFHSQISVLYSSSPLGIGISVVVVIIAALNLVLDFDMIETGSPHGRSQIHGVVRRVRH